MFFKLLTVAVVAALLWQMIGVWRTGRVLAKNRTSAVFRRHQVGVAYIGWLTILAVVLIEVQVWMSPAPYASGPLLLGFHLAVDALMVAVFAAIVLHFSGVKSPQWHSTLAYSFLGLYCLAAATGGVMLYRLPT